VTITDPVGLMATSTVNVTASQTLQGVTVSPATASLTAGGTQQFTVTGQDQFGQVIAGPAVVWSLTGPGKLSGSGLYTPPYASGSATVQATSGGFGGTASITFAGQAQWTSAAAADWNSNGSWKDSVSSTTIAAPGLRGIQGDTVLFASATGGTANLNGQSPTLAGITFNDTATSYTIAQGSGGTLRLANGTGLAMLTVAAGWHTISAPIELDSNVMVLPVAGSRLTILGNMNGAGQSLTVNDRGTAVLSGANGYRGGTTVSAGTLILTNPSAIAANTSLTIGADAAFIFGSSSITTSNDTTTASNAVSAVTSSDTGVTVAAPLSANVALSSPVRLATVAAGDSQVQSLATVVTTPPALPLPASRPGRQTNDLRESVTAIVLATTDVGWNVGSSTARRIVRNLAWLEQAASSPENWDSSDQNHKKDQAILALEAVIAQYGR